MKHLFNKIKLLIRPYAPIFIRRLYRRTIDIVLGITGVNILRDRKIYKYLTSDKDIPLDMLAQVINNEHRLSKRIDIFEKLKIDESNYRYIQNVFFSNIYLEPELLKNPKTISIFESLLAYTDAKKVSLIEGIIKRDRHSEELADNIAFRDILIDDISELKLFLLLLSVTNNLSKLKFFVGDRRWSQNLEDEEKVTAGALLLRVLSYSNSKKTREMIVSDMKKTKVIQRGNMDMPLISYMHESIYDYLDKRSIHQSKAANNFISKYRILAQTKNKILSSEVNINGDIFQLPYAKSLFNQGQIDALVIDNRLEDLAQSYIPGLEIISKIPFREYLTNKNFKNLLPRDAKRSDLLSLKRITKYRDFPINYSSLSFHPIVLDARKNGIYSDNAFNTISKKFVESVKNYGNFITLSFESSNATVWRKSELPESLVKYLYDKKYKIINTTPNLSDEQRKTFEDQLSIKIIQPEIDLWNDFTSIAFLMKKASINFVPPNNLMELGGAANANTVVLDNHKYMNDWKVQDNSYVFWSSVRFLNNFDQINPELFLDEYLD